MHEGGISTWMNAGGAAAFGASAFFLGMLGAMYAGRASLRVTWKLPSGLAIYPGWAGAFAFGLQEHSTTEQIFLKVIMTCSSWRPDSSMMSGSSFASDDVLVIVM